MNISTARSSYLIDIAIKRWAPVFCITFVLGYFLRIVGNKFRGTDSYNYFIFYNGIEGWEGLFNAYYLGDYLFSIGTYAIWLTGVDGHWYLYIVFIAIVSTFLISPSKLFNQKEDALYYVAVFLLLCSSSLYLLSLNGLRQGAATAVALVGIYNYISSKRTILSVNNVIYFLLAFFLHKSSIVVPVSILVLEVINRRISPIVLIMSCLMAGVVFKELLPLLVELANIPGVSDEFVWYDSQKSGSTSILLKVAFMVVFAICFYYLSRRSKDYRLVLLVRVYIFLTAIQLLFLGYEMMINRFLLYTSMLEPVIIVRQSSSIKNKFMYLLIASIFGLFYLFSILLWHPSFRDELGLM